MADGLKTPQQCADYFEHYVAARLHHWRDHAAVQTIDIATLDAEQEHILKAISLGLALDERWVAVRDLIVAFAPYMERRGHWDAWHSVLLHAIVAAQRMGDTQSEITLTILLAKLCQRQSKPAEVVCYYRRVIRLARQMSNHYAAARACSNLGFHYIDRGHWWRSEVLSCYALAIFEQLDSKHGRAHTHNHLGLLYTRQRVWDKAEAQLTQACALWQQMGDGYSLIYGYENLGLLYYETEKSAESIKYLESALHQSHLTGEESETGNILNNLGIAYIQLGQFEQAQNYLEQAEHIYRQFSNTLGIAHVWHNLGVIALRLGKRAAAQSLLENSLALYHDLQSQDGVTKVMFSLIECAMAGQSYQQALVYSKELESQISHHSLGEQGNQQRYIHERLQEVRRSLAAML